ncbi:MAG: hypothetical protein ABI193_01295 [Minicystis sp.]
MSADSSTEDLVPEDAHPKAREALTDRFFWDANDVGSPLGGDTGIEVLDALRDYRAEKPKGDPTVVLDELLVRWEVSNEGWDAVSEATVQELGAEDEFSLLTRDEALLALTFAQIVVEGKVHHELRRRALLALRRQALPALLHGWGDRRLERAARIERMREILAKSWA